MNKIINAIDMCIIYSKNFNIDYFLISGTLLGYVRHNDFIPYDDDMELIVSADIKKIIPDIMKKYNIDNLIQFPEISRFDPVASVIGIKPNEICEIIRPSKTSIYSEYYRVCV